MNPCELVARLNPGSVRLDGGGRGGIPEYTPQDIAAAIGMVPDLFAREVFCAIWWPDGAKLVWHELDAMIGALQFGEWRARAEQMVDAQLREAQVSFFDAPRRAETISQARDMLDKARSRMWPALGEEPYALIRVAVIAELRAARVCPCCKGRGSATAGTRIIQCADCVGTGRIAVSDVQRAAMLRRNESSYRRTWRRVYEWTFARVGEAESKGRVAVAQCLSDRAAA